jgi:hypothetical protein
VIAVFVGDENGGQTFGRAGQGGEALADLAATETHVNEQPRFVRFHDTKRCHWSRCPAL